MPDARFFPDAELSVVEHVLRHTGRGPAVIAEPETGTRTIPWDELPIEVGAMAAALAAEGVGERDRVGAGLPNRLAAVVPLTPAAAPAPGFPPPTPDFGSPAVIAESETGTRTISWDGLAIEVGAMAAALAAEGVGEGDRVGAWLPNGIEAVVAMLGAAALGAVFSSTSPDFGAPGVLDRFGQIEPAVLFAVDGYDYGGRHFDRRDVRRQIVAGLPSLRRTVVTGDDWEAFLGPHRGTPAPLDRRSFHHPWYVLYSSGTTGTPKCIVHATGRE